ncbi:MAG: hypothetical protein H7259_00445 [Cytophagales bacterium]|nr:hypothetical protein [Cytophaga sp.]
MNRFLLLTTVAVIFVSGAHAQSIELTNDFRLGSPYYEPDGTNDVVKLKGGDFITIAKMKGGVSGKSDFAIERYNGSNLIVKWQKVISIDGSEDFKDLYYNGKDVVLLSVIHDEAEKKTKLLAYAYSIENGSEVWKKDLETYSVGTYLENEHRGKVKESFIDIICEHTKPSFVTPFEYKHNIRFAPDESKFVSYVFNYSESSLFANVCIYDQAGNILTKGKVTIDNGYVNYGMYINNKGELFVVNANKGGKINVIRLDLTTKQFSLIEMPGSSYQRDELMVHFVNDDELFVGAIDVYEDKLVGVTFGDFNFADMALEKHMFDKFDDAVKNIVIEGRKTNKLTKGEESWTDYDLSHFFINEHEEVIMVLEKRVLYADGYPHITPGAFDKKHQVELDGHVHAEGILLLSYAKDETRKWVQYIAKNQVYAATDGLNTISYVIDNTHASNLRIMYASSAAMDASVFNINLVHIDRSNGKKVKEAMLPNEAKLMIVRDYTIWDENDKIILVGRKGLLGKTSAIVRYKL